MIRKQSYTKQEILDLTDLMEDTIVPDLKKKIDCDTIEVIETCVDMLRQQRSIITKLDAAWKGIVG
jgi:hypothetical protein